MVAALALVVVGGTVGFLVLGYSLVDSVFQTVTLITTVGFTEPHRPDTAEKVFIVVLVLVGVGTALYAFGILIEVLVEGQLAATVWRRRMEKRIAGMSGHVIVCGWGRVGRAITDNLARRHVPVVVVDSDPARLEGITWPYVIGDATDDAVLDTAGAGRARALVATMSTDAANLYVTLSGKAMNPDLFIVGRVRVASAEEKLLRAGADRVVNPQAIGGARIAALLVEPHVSEFLDVVTREAGLEFRLSELQLADTSSVVGQTLADAHIRRRTGALVLAVRAADGRFLTNPPPDTVLGTGQVLIAIGTEEELASLSLLAGNEQT